jgi:general stress protein 26
MSDDQTRKVAELLKGERFAFLTTVMKDGRLASRPMTLQEVEFDGDLWFFAERESNPVRHITDSPQVNVGVGSGGTWVSLSGDAVLVEDVAKKRELWNSAVEAWFPGARRRQRRPAQGGVGLRGGLGQPGRAARDGVQLRQGEGHRRADRGRGEREGRPVAALSRRPGCARSVRRPSRGARSRSGRPARDGRTGSPGPGRSPARAAPAAGPRSPRPRRRRRGPGCGPARRSR